MQLINKLLEHIFPVREDYLLVKQTNLEEIKEKFNPTNQGQFLSLASFSDPTIKACVHEVKYHENERAVKFLASLLKIYLADKPKHLLVPIPLSYERRRERGYNQVELLAKATNNKSNANLLRRTKNTKPQTQLSRSDRLENMHDAFAVVSGTKNLTGQDIIILDDVVTTGATLRAARAKLAPLNPSSITSLAIAH